MQYSNISQYLSDTVAVPLKTYLTLQYGKNGLKIESEIRSSLQWRPTIQIKMNRFSILGIEVSDQLYPSILKIAAHEINSGFHDLPVHIAVACPLAVYQADNGQKITNQLRKNGVGLYTVDDQGGVVEQFASTAIMHHINEDLFETKLTNLPQSVKVKLRSAYKVYRTNCYQGTQDVGQLVEAIVMGFANDAYSKGWIGAFNRRGSVANIIDDLYASSANQLVSQRAAIGGARSYIRYFRNLSSHPATTTAEAVKLITDCRDGFLNALSVVDNLNTAIINCQLRIKILIP